MAGTLRLTEPAAPARLPGRRALALGLVGAALGALYAANFGALRAVAGPQSDPLQRWYPLLFTLLFLLYLAGVWLAWCGGRRAALGVVAAGMLFRIAMMPTPVVLSSDVYRYLWDGRVQVAGINPYRHPPQAEALAPLRDAEVHPHINRPWAPTIYPPGAQMVFAALAWIAPDRLWALRVFLTLCELATMLLLMASLRRLGLPQGRTAIYAWAPLAVFEFAQAGHIDAALIPLVLGAVLARVAGRHGLAGALLGGATLIKLYPAVLLPVLWKPRAPRLAAAFVAVIMLGYAPYAWSAGWQVAGFLPAYFGRAEDFNVGLRALLTEGIGLGGEGARRAVMVLLAGATLAAILAIARARPETPLGLARASGAAVGAYLLLVPSSMHPWYVPWLIPFLAVLPGAGWWYLTWAVSLSYVGYAAQPHQVPVWVRMVEYLPAYALVLAALWAARRGPGWLPARLNSRAAT